MLEGRRRSGRLAVKVFRLYAYRGGQYSRRLFHLSTELRGALSVLAERSRMPSPRCGHVFFRAAAAGLPSDHGHLTG
ncbi:hypothetical protein GCM10010390_28010 [Streptomyces mordarskii]|uniref:Transposase n=1 Tax=Streptomyces mordarskii TaxID=1226758 RepID=A0ABN1CQX7_9ACTN